MDALIDKMKIPPSLLGKLNETNINKSTNSELRNSLEKDGYLFLRNIFNPNEIEAARNDVFKRLNEVNELKEPYKDGISSGKSNRDKLFDNRGDFWESVSSIKSLRQVTNGKILENVFSKIFGSPSIGFDFSWLSDNFINPSSSSLILSTIGLNLFISLSLDEPKNFDFIVLNILLLQLFKNIYLYIFKAI